MSITQIETVIITPLKDMPFEVYKECYRLSVFMELMSRLPNGQVLWEHNHTYTIDEDMAKIHYDLLQKDWFSFTMELPKKFVAENLQQ